MKQFRETSAVNSGMIKLWGSIKAHGNFDNKISFYHTQIALGGNNASGVVADYNYCEFNNSPPYIPYNNADGVLFLRNSRIVSTGEIYVKYPTDDCVIEKNSFIDSSILIGPTGGHSIFITNNLFFSSSSSRLLYVYSNYTSNVIIENNSFLSSFPKVVGITQGVSVSPLVAIDNYWGTTNIAKINEMINDKSDNLAIGNYVEFEPFLTEPHPDTPILNLNSPPIANAGQDQIIFDTITLDGSLSSDPDNDPVTYSWQATNRKNPNNNRAATGVSPTITNLQPGFYNVTLTVTDSGGFSNTDTMIFAATGTAYTQTELDNAVANAKVAADAVIANFDINSDGKIGLEEAIRALQVSSGQRP